MTQDRTQGTWKQSVSLCHPSTLEKAGGNDFWIQNILCFRKCVKWIWIECMWYQRISTTDILETCDTKRLMWQRICVTLNALNMQSTDSKIHDICREFWTKETYKGILCFGLNAFNDIARRLEMCLPVYESRAHKIPHGFCFIIWAFLIFFWKLKDFLWNKTSLNSQSSTNSQFV